ncbi:hypothetical protein [Sphingomicrobium aestuariivivum]|uniref:hypothetical protein n=1 Tax=Sphingomicrobium aestuariivivum TaxID=1582356 RepID=UPI001FD6BC9D|nr:hypothetical protein [Sphingomicrobium aestuariivivum]MCJ8191276.1 hypothetical protein [Sphingomicrobium aestuariivivum]
MTNRSKTLRNLFLLGTAASALSACGADDVASPGDGVLVVVENTGGTPTTPPTTPPTNGSGEAAESCPDGFTNFGTIEVGGSGSGDERRICQLPGQITNDLFVENLEGVIYALGGKTEVGIDTGADGNLPGGDAASLTFDAGVVLFGRTQADFLVVNRGSQLFVQGTADAPVVMTARANVVGSANADTIGEWGGLVILGQAPTEGCGDGTTSAPCGVAVEGTAGSSYGGVEAGDSSGSIEYLQIRYSGFKAAEDSELNGITLAGVGSGTTFNHVQVHNSSDDGIEWFGGRVNQKYLVLTGNDDDSIDADNGFKGAIQYALIIQRETGGDKLMEIDSPGDQALLPRTNIEVANFTYITPRDGEYVHVRGAADIALYNGLIVAAGPCIDMDEQNTVDASTGLGEELGAPRIKGVYLDCTTDPIRDDAEVTAAEIAALFDGSSNTTFDSSITLPSPYAISSVNFINSNAATEFDDYSALQFGSFFDAVDYVGAVEDANDDWWVGWTCGLEGQMSCLEIPSAG